MELETRWGDDTVSLGRREADGLAAERTGAEEALEAKKTSVTEGDPRSGAEAVVLDRNDEGRRRAAPWAGRREHRALLGAAAGMALTLLAIGVANRIGNGGERKPQTPAATVGRKAFGPSDPRTATGIKEDQTKRLKRWSRAAHAAAERQRQERRERHPKAQDKGPAADEAAPAPASDAEPDDVPEYSPEAVPETQAAPGNASPAASGTPPSVEFGM
jgi:hypothetical protein